LINDHPRCLKCYPFIKSNIEIELQDFCKEYFNESELLFNDKTIISPLELDVVIPSIRLAVELNGNYWHSEVQGNKDSNYHLSKTDAAKSKGYQLIHIFEDEWVNKKDIVKSILINKFGKTPNRVYGRKCKIVNLTNKIAKQFLNDNHIQGFIGGTHYGLEHNNTLVSILTVGKPRFNKNYDYEILRFCNKLNHSVIGGLSKLIKNIKNPKKSIISYADKRYGDGLGYINIGFKKINESSPNYWYFSNKTKLLRESRIKYQKHKLKDILKSFDPKLTEFQNMVNNGYDRIWDCGNIVLELI
jgi:very-short-patch-repair endonuclease